MLCTSCAVLCLYHVTLWFAQPPLLTLGGAARIWGARKTAVLSNFMAVEKNNSLKMKR